MDSIGVLKMAFEGSHNWFQGTIADVTEEQANALPPGVAHPIGELAAHVLHSEDGMLAIVQGREPIWVRDGWGERLGLPMMVDHTTEGARAFRCNPADLKEYAEAVYANTDAFLSGLSPEDLDKPVDFTSVGIGHMPLSQFLLNMLLGNNFAHTGEISALKGTLGARGYPF